MDKTTQFNLAQARPGIEKTLEQQGFDIQNDPDEPNLIQAQRSQNASTSIVIDAGGQLRYTVTRSNTPQQSQLRKTAAGLEYNVTREVNETLTITLQLAQNTDLSALLQEFTKL